MPARWPASAARLLRHAGIKATAAHAFSMVAPSRWHPLAAAKKAPVGHDKPRLVEPARANCCPQLMGAHSASI